MNERVLPEHPYLKLKARLESDLVGLESIALGLDTALERALADLDEFSTRALTSYVDDFYKRCERICKRVAVTIDADLPQGAAGHIRLLYQMGTAGGYARPPLLSESLLSQLDEYRRFCYRAQRSHSCEPDAEYVLFLASGIRPMLPQLHEAIDTFCAWLQAQT
jgi:hypothetical protein